MEYQELFNKETTVLYQGRFCDQENFDYIIAGIHNEKDCLKGIYKVKGPSFENVDTLISNSSRIQHSLTSGSSICIIRSQKNKT